MIHRSDRTDRSDKLDLSPDFHFTTNSQPVTGNGTTVRLKCGIFTGSVFRQIRR